jgi:hypothetical protein
MTYSFSKDCIKKKPVDEDKKLSHKSSSANANVRCKPATSSSTKINSELPDADPWLPNECKPSIYDINHELSRSKIPT